MQSSHHMLCGALAQSRRGGLQQNQQVLQTEALGTTLSLVQVFFVHRASWLAGAINKVHCASQAGLSNRVPKARHSTPPRVIRVIAASLQTLRPAAASIRSYAQLAMMQISASPFLQQIKRPFVPRTTLLTAR